LLIIAYDLTKTNELGIGNINAIAINAAENFNIRTVLLTSSASIAAENFSKKNNLVMEVFYADAVPLKSMVRANPGVILMKNGTVINKWHFRNLPSYDELLASYFSKN